MILVGHLLPSANQGTIIFHYFHFDILCTLFYYYFSIIFLLFSLFFDSFQTSISYYLYLTKRTIILINCFLLFSSFFGINHLYYLTIIYFSIFFVILIICFVILNFCFL